MVSRKKFNKSEKSFFKGVFGDINKENFEEYNYNNNIERAKRGLGMIMM